MDGELQRKVEKHDCDLYYGNGKPGITTRIALAEKEIVDVREDMTEFKKDAKATRNMVIGLILAAVVQIIVRLIFK